MSGNLDEPPYADPWCGGWGRKTPGYPIGRIIPKSHRVLIVRTGVTVANMVQMNRKLGGIQRLALPQILAGNDHFVPRLQAGYGRFPL